MRGLEYIYFVRDLESNLIKIGRAKDLKQRYKELGREMSKPEFIYAFRVTDGAAEEKRLHALFDSNRVGVGGERFRLEDAALDAIAALVGNRLIRYPGPLLGIGAMLYTELPVTPKLVIDYLLVGLMVGAAAIGLYEGKRSIKNPRE